MKQNDSVKKRKIRFLCLMMAGFLFITDSQVMNVFAQEISETGTDETDISGVSEEIMGVDGTISEDDTGFWGELSDAMDMNLGESDPSSSEPEEEVKYYNIIYDEETVDKDTNPNTQKRYKYRDKIYLKPMPAGEHDGKVFAGYEFEFKGDTTGRKTAVAGTGSHEGQLVIDTERHTSDITIYAVWHQTYNISYVGIKVSSDPADALTDGSQTIDLDGDLYNVMAVDSDIAADDLKLPTFYTTEETTVLPTAAEMNEKQPDKEFAEYNRFLFWSASRRVKKAVKTLGKDGDITSGDVVLYVIYTAKYPVPQVEESRTATEKEYKAVQVYFPNILDTDEYAVVNLVGTGVSADPDTAELVLTDEQKKYFEQCEVDHRAERLGNGYAAIGIRLKDGVDAATAAMISKKADLKKFSIKVQSKAHETDEKGEPVYYTTVANLKLNYKLPKYALTSKAGTIYTTALTKTGSGEVSPAVFTVREKQGLLASELYSGKWETDYVTKSGKEFKVVDAADVSVSINASTKDITVIASKAMKGFIRLRNSSWVKGAYVYLPYSITENKKEPKIEFNVKGITLGNDVATDSAVVSIIFSKGMKTDPSKVTIDKTGLPAGITADYDDASGILSVTGAKDVKAGTYRIFASAEGCSKKAVLAVKVSAVKPEKCVKLKVSGKIDSLMGGSIYLAPTIKTVPGSIASVKMVSADSKTPAWLDSYWDGTSIELYTNDKFVPGVTAQNVNLEITLNTGRVLPASFKVKPVTGKLLIDVYDVTVKYPSVEAPVTAEEGEPAAITPKDDTAPTVYAPVMATYTYYSFTDAKTKVIKTYTVDLTRASDRKLLEIAEKPIAADKAGRYAVSYKDGVLTITGGSTAPAKATDCKLQLSGKWAPNGKLYKAGFTLKLVP